MGLPRIFAELKDNKSGSSTSLSKQDFHHIADVLRLRNGDKIELIDKLSGQGFIAEIVGSSPTLNIKIIDNLPAPANTNRLNSIAFALCKGDRNDTVVEKATELGAQNVILWQAERSVVKITEASLKSKVKRWSLIAEAAAKQSKRHSIPTIRVTNGASGVIGELKTFSNPEDAYLMCSLSAQAIHPTKLPPPQGQVHLIVGPEGDLTPCEEQQFIDYGFKAVTLGPNILRSETAAISCMSLAYGLWPLEG